MESGGKAVLAGVRKSRKLKELSLKCSRDRDRKKEDLNKVTHILLPGKQSRKPD